MDNLTSLLNKSFVPHDPKSTMASPEKGDGTAKQSRATLPSGLFGARPQPKPSSLTSGSGQGIEGEDSARMQGQITYPNLGDLSATQSQPKPSSLGLFGPPSQIATNTSGSGQGIEEEDSDRMQGQITYPNLGDLSATQSQSKPSFPLQSPPLHESGAVSPLSEGARPITYRKPQAEDEGDDLFVSASPNSSNGQQKSHNNSQAEIERILQCGPDEWYTILGVSDTCSTEEANKAYKRLALMIHPDRCGLEGATEAAACKLKGPHPFITSFANSIKWSQQLPMV
jgi:hypothetical protein